ncbi:glycosyltransferase family 4 protein [Janibacter melonis]|uniref:glycosyltransferase family 4 protein n=1 Tax=Janibacter melonis TaxID=262209 RepID=UPI001E52AFE9|nr:glycosyltransferase family 4 protein [Janibacter melonis]MCB5991420.1 glycosyltransferase family 4 protein [Janibacter melonis]
MPRVLLIAPTCDGQDVGESWVSAQWARHLAQRCDTTLVTYHKRTATPAAEQLDGLRVVEWIEPPLLGRAERLNSIAKPGYVSFYRRARRWVADALAAGEHFDLAFQPTPVAMRYPSPVVGLGVPTIVGPVGGGLADPPGFSADGTSEPWYYRLRELDGMRLRRDRLLRRTFEEADCVLGIADYVAEALSGLTLKRFETMPETAVAQIPEPVERVAGPRVRALFAGRLVRSKGVHELVDALAATTAPVDLEIAGVGPEEESLRRQVAALGLEDRVTFHGWVERPAMAELYRRADIFAFPSYREPGGNAPLEAMSWGLPLVVAARGGPGAFTTDECAIRLPVISPERFRTDITAALDRLGGDAALRRAMGEAGRRHVAATATWPAKVDRLLALGAELAADRR